MKPSLILLLVMSLLLTSCASARAKDPFKVDTVVMIPVDPTEEPTEEPTEAPTAEPTEEATEMSTEPKETAPKKTSSGSSSGKGSSGKTQKPKQTEPPQTEPPIATLPLVEMPTEPPFDPSSYNPGNLEYALLEAMNTYRMDAGVEALTLKKKLSGIAYVRAQEAVDYWSHTRPDGRGYTSALSDYGYSYGSSAELMVYATGSGDADTMVDKWMDSASHSEKILSAGFTTVGIGVCRSGGMTYVVCLLIG